MLKYLKVTISGKPFLFLGLEEYGVRFGEGYLNPLRHIALWEGLQTGAVAFSSGTQPCNQQTSKEGAGVLQPFLPSTCLFWAVPLIGQSRLEVRSSGAQLDAALPSLGSQPQSKVERGSGG